MKKIKKWQILVLVILGIGGYWLSQNLWVFEVKIPEDQYKEKIVGTWVNNEDNIIFWSQDNEFTSSGFQEISNFEKRELFWKVDKDELRIYGFWIPESFTKPCTEFNKSECTLDENLATEFESYVKIIHLGETYLVLQYDKNSSLNKKPKKVIFKKIHRNV